MKRLSVALGALALASGWALPAPVEAGRLGRSVVPTFQAVELAVDAEQTDYSGTVRLTLEVREPTDHFSLHARDMTLESVSLQGPDGPVDTTYGIEGDLLTVRAAAPLAVGEHTLAIDFEGPFNTQAVALYRMEQDGLAYAFSQFEAADARGAFPCFDEPEFKIPWQLTVRVPEAHIAVSNTPVENETSEEGWTTYVFQKTKPLPSYLIALATGPLDTVDMPGLGIPARIVTPKGQARLASIAIEQSPPLLKALEAYFGEPYPYAKLDYIAIPEYWPGAMENPGAITFASGILLLDPESASLAERRRLAKVIAHELAHMWFGDKVTMEWWNDLWLNESFADWMGDKITNEVFPELRMDLEVVRDAQGIMGADAQPTSAPIRRPVESTETLLQDVGIQYNKGKAVLGMFEAWIGPEVFRRGVLDYIKANAWGNATAEDLWAALDASSGKKLAHALATFIDQPGLPLVGVELVGEGQVRLTQRRFGGEGVTLDAQTWAVPVALRLGGPGGSETRTVLLEGPEAVIDLETTPEWVYPNVDGVGYYRWQVPDTMLTRLTEEAPAPLDAAERMDLVGNLSALLNAGVIDGGRFLASLRTLADDPEPMVVGSVLDQLEELQQAFVPADQEEAFAAYVRRALRPVLDRIGMLPRPGEAETAALVRPRLLGWLGDAGRDPQVRRFAVEQAAAYLEDPGSVPSSIASVCLSLAAMEGGEPQFEAMRQRFESASTPSERSRYLLSLGAFRDPEVVDRALDYAFSGPLRPNELFTIPRGVRETPAGAERAWRWLTEHYAQIGARLPGEYMAYMPYFAAGCSAERLEAARAFFDATEHQAQGTARTLSRVADGVEECLALRAREGASVREYLEREGT
jgi:alanyl aminopeptidase